MQLNWYSNANVFGKLKLLNKKFDKLEADVDVISNANSLFSSRLVDTKRQCWANAQFSRREILEIVESTKISTNDEVEMNVGQIFQSLNCNVNNNNSVACRYLKDQE